MKSHYRVVVIGGGVVGASVAYHLTKAGWSDIALIEREVLTAGSSWHAAGGFHALNSDPNIAALQTYTIRLLQEIERESGLSVGMHMTGGISFACAPERWEWQQAAYRIYQSMGNNDVRLIGPDEIAERCPMVDTKGILGGMWAEHEGYIDPSGVVHAYARCARNRGAEVIEHNRVLELHPAAGPAWQVVTEKGTITAEHVVNAAGLWAKQVGRMAGLELPVSPMEHHYLVTEPLPVLQGAAHEMPMMVDLEGGTYMRQEGKGVLLGLYEQDFRHWQMEGAPWDYGMDLIQEDPERIAPELATAFERYPALQTAGVRRWVNGAFTFSPDGNPLVGPVRGLPGYWLACGVMAGFLQGGGVGKALAEWMVSGQPQEDIFGMDIARYGTFASAREYIRQTTGQFYARRFVISYPNEQLPAGRPLKTAGAHDEMTAAGARWGVSWGLEVPLYFAPPEFTEHPSLRRSNADPLVAAEMKAVREAAGLTDISGYSRYEVTGEGAQEWLDRLLASRLPTPGRARLAPMLGHDGRLRGDLTVLNWGGGRFWLMGSYYLREWHMRWFAQNIREGVMLRDISDEVGGFALAGPCAREVLARATAADVSREALPFMACARMDVGLVHARVARISLSGEVGFEINCPAPMHRALRRALLAAGEGLGLREVGFAAQGALRLEKSYGIWSREFTQDRTAAETGLDRFIAWNKGAFIGREAAQALPAPTRRLVTLEVAATDADASGYEPVWHQGRLVGHVTSGGFGHTLGRSLALALVETGAAEPGTELAVHVVGEERAAKVIAPSPYDPEGLRMRA